MTERRDCRPARKAAPGERQEPSVLPVLDRSLVVLGARGPEVLLGNLLLRIDERFPDDDGRGPLHGCLAQAYPPCGDPSLAAGAASATRRDLRRSGTMLDA
jgi:hypothetical protein